MVENAFKNCHYFQWLWIKAVAATLSSHFSEKTAEKILHPTGMHNFWSAKTDGNSAKKVCRTKLRWTNEELRLWVLVWCITLILHKSPAKQKNCCSTKPLKGILKETQQRHRVHAPKIKQKVHLDNFVECSCNLLSFWSYTEKAFSERKHLELYEICFGLWEIEFYPCCTSDTVLFCRRKQSHRKTSYGLPLSLARKDHSFELYSHFQPFIAFTSVHNRKLSIDGVCEGNLWFPLLPNDEYKLTQEIESHETWKSI